MNRTYRIVNLFRVFQNSYNEPGWQLWRGQRFVGVYRTRAEARYARDRQDESDEPIDYETWQRM